MTPNAGAHGQSASKGVAQGLETYAFSSISATGMGLGLRHPRTALMPGSFGNAGEIGPTRCRARGDTAAAWRRP